MTVQDRVVDALWLYFQSALRVYFRSIEVEGAANVPASGPVILVSNHLNAFVDPLFVQIGFRRRLTITAKGPLVVRPLLGRLMRAARVIAFHRQQDLGDEADIARTLRDLDECRRRLVEGAAICFFPEAKSHDDARMRPFKHGASRIALDFVRVDGDPGGALKIVPVGLSFEAKEHLRSRVVVRYGEPIEVRRWIAQNPGADHAALTRELEARVRGLIVEFEDASQSSLLRWTARLMATDRRGHEAFKFPEPAYSALLRVTERVRDGDSRRRRSRPDAGESIRERVRMYRNRLRALKVEPEDVFVAAGIRGVVRFAAQEASILLPSLPFATWGAIHNVLPALAVCMATRRMSKLRDLWASNAIFSSIVAFPLLYTLQWAAASRFMSTSRSALYASTWPVAGYAAIRFGDRLRRDLRRARAVALFIAKPALHRDIVAEARAILDDLDDTA